MFLQSLLPFTSIWHFVSPICHRESIHRPERWISFPEPWLPWVQIPSSSWLLTIQFQGSLFLSSSGSKYICDAQACIQQNVVSQCFEGVCGIDRFVWLAVCCLFSQCVTFYLFLHCQNLGCLYCFIVTVTVAQRLLFWVSVCASFWSWGINPGPPAY